MLYQLSYVRLIDRYRRRRAGATGSPARGGRAIVIARGAGLDCARPPGHPCRAGAIGGQGMTDSALTLTALQLAGFVGVALYLLAYALLQFGFIRGQGYAYPALNMLAAGLVLLGLAEEFNLPAAIVQVSFVAISVVGLLRHYRAMRRARFTDAERSMMEAIGLDLSAPHARDFLDLGRWVEAEPGTVLTLENRPVHELVVLLEGEAVVTIEDEVTALCEPICMIGEITCLEGRPATASVAVTRRSHLFCVGARQLRRHVARRPEVASALRGCFADQLGIKLRTANSLSRHLIEEINTLAARQRAREAGEGSGAVAPQAGREAGSG